MALPGEGYVLCAEKGDDGAAVLSDALVKRGVRRLMRGAFAVRREAPVVAPGTEKLLVYPPRRALMLGWRVPPAGGELSSPKKEIFAPRTYGGASWGTPMWVLRHAPWKLCSS